MTAVFLYGTLMHAGLRRVVLGREATLVPATLAGRAVCLAAGGSYPVLVAGDGAQGGVLAAGPGDLDRLDHYEGVFGYRREAVAVQTAGGPVAAEVYLRADPPPPGPPFDLADWVERWGAVARLAAEEVMRGLGTRSADEIARQFGIIRARAQARLRGQAHRRPRTLGAAPPAERIETLSVSRPYESFFTVEEHVIRHPRFDGALSGPVARAAFTVAEAVTVLPYDPVRDRVLLVEQVRLGALVSGDPDPWLLEPVAGMVDAGESYEECARRETREEARLDLGRLHVVSRYYPSPGGVAQVLISYVGLADLPDGHAGQGGLDAEGEDIRIHLTGLDHLMAMVASNEVAVAPLILSAQWLALNRDRLRAAPG